MILIIQTHGWLLDRHQSSGGLSFGLFCFQSLYELALQERAEPKSIAR